MRKAKKQYMIIGLGRFGTGVARSLCALGHEVLAIDADSAKVEEAAPHVTQAVQADATDEDALRALDAASFDAAVVAIGTDIRASVLAVVLCRELGVPHIVAKAVDDLHAKVLRKVGADRVVFPERDMGARVARALAAPNTLEMMELAGDYELAEIQPPQKWQGKTLAETDVRRRYGLSVVAIRRGEQLIASPGGEETLHAEDLLLVMGKRNQLEQLEAL